MIPRRELEQLRAEWSLELAVIEKDYVLGWLLAGIAHHPQLGRGWVFKGGTCLRKCYYETFRFSEDLDFTVTEGGLEEPEDLRADFSEVADWLREESGIELTVDDNAFRRRRNRRGNPTTQGRIAYRGPKGQDRHHQRRGLGRASSPQAHRPPVQRCPPPGQWGGLLLAD